MRDVAVLSRLELTAPDDWHLHLRDGAVMAAVAPYSAAHFARALIMPNLLPPISTVQAALAYRQQIMDACARSGHRFTPYMSLYLTEATPLAEIDRAAENPAIIAAKLYPAGATTNSDAGVRSFDKIIPVLERMAERDMVLCVHGEVSAEDVDIFDREAVFLDKVLAPLQRAVPDLRITLEHITTKEGIDYVRAGGDKIAGTLTVHHLLFNRNALLAGGIRPHYYCLPILKREHHRAALVAAALSGERRFFLGTDSAPHTDSAKHSDCGCAGCFTAANALSCLAHIFEQGNALDKLGAFIAHNGAAHYSMPVNSARIVLEKREDAVMLPAKIAVAGTENITLFSPGFPLHWHVVQPA